MKRIVMALVVLSLLVVGCAESPIPPISVPITPVAPEPTEPSSIPSPIVLHKEPPEDMTWISPGKVNVGNFYPGARAEWDLLVHNGKDSVATFKVKYREPNYVDRDYTRAPAEARDWVIIVDATPAIMPRETKEILIALDMPEEAMAPPKWEFWISVMETTQTGSIHTELCSRWQISMRE